VGTVSPLQIVRRTDVNAAVVQLKKIYVLQSTYAKAQGGVPGEIRTHDPRIRNPVLYPTELRGRRQPRVILASGAAQKGQITSN
jgi:hypothetical protein